MMFTRFSEASHKASIPQRTYDYITSDGDGDDPDSNKDQNLDLIELIVFDPDSDKIIQLPDTDPELPATKPDNK